MNTLLCCVSVQKLEQFLDNPKLSANKAFFDAYSQEIASKSYVETPWTQIAGPKLQKIWDQSLAQYYPTQDVQYLTGKPGAIYLGHCFYLGF